MGGYGWYDMKWEIVWIHKKESDILAAFLSTTHSFSTESLPFHFLSFDMWNVFKEKGEVNL